MFLNITKPENISAEELFKLATEKCLEKNYNEVEVVELFTKSFLVEHNIDSVGILPLAMDEITIACKRGNNVLSFSNDFFSKSESVPTDIAVLFHELTHILTDKHNKNSLDNVKAYVNPSYGYGFYLTSPNEMASRLAEIEYLNKFIKILKNSKHKNRRMKNKFISKSLKNIRLKNKHIKNITKETNLIKSKLSNKLKEEAQSKLYIIKTFDTIDINDSLRYDEEMLEDMSVYSNEVLNYLATFQDTELFDKILNLNPKSFFWNDIALSDVLNTNCRSIKKEEYSKLIALELAKDNFAIITKIEQKEIIKNKLLFEGDKQIKSLQAQGNLYMEHLDEKVVESTLNLYADYEFKGLFNDLSALKNWINKTSGEEKLTSNNSNLYEIMYEASKYINSTILDNLTEEKVDKINAIFNTEVIVKKNQKTNKIEKDDKINYKRDYNINKETNLKNKENNEELIC